MNDNLKKADASNREDIVAIWNKLNVKCQIPKDLKIQKFGKKSILELAEEMRIADESEIKKEK